MTQQRNTPYASHEPVKKNHNTIKLSTKKGQLNLRSLNLTPFGDGETGTGILSRKSRFHMPHREQAISGF